MSNLVGSSAYAVLRPSRQPVTKMTSRWFTYCSAWLVLTTVSGNTKPNLFNETRVAVCFWGLTRSLWATRDSLRIAVLDPLYKEGFEVQKFLHTFELEQDSGHPISWDDYKWLDIPRGHVTVEHVDEVDKAKDTPSLEAVSVHGDVWRDNGYSTANHRLALHSLKSVTLLWSADVQEFDLILYTRTDLLFFQPLDLREVMQAISSPATIYIPPWDHWGGALCRMC